MRHITVTILPNNALRAEFSSRLTGRTFSATINKKNRLHIRHQDVDFSDSGTDKIITHCTPCGGMTEQHWVRYPVDVTSDLAATVESFRQAIDRFIYEHEWLTVGPISQAWMDAAKIAGAKLESMPAGERHDICRKSEAVAS